MPLLEKLHSISLAIAVHTMVVLAHMMRMTRAAILNVMQSAYIETAELKGLSSFEVIRRHAFPNAVAPIVNVVMINLALPRGGCCGGRGQCSPIQAWANIWLMRW